MAAIAEGKFTNTEADKGPRTVRAVPRLKRDLVALRWLTKSESPPRQPMRSKQRAAAWYLVGDASGDGFGSGLFADGVLKYESGDWANYARENLSNWREAANLVVRIEEGVESGFLFRVELFIFTDNMVFEGTYYKADSSSPELHFLVL